MVDLFRIGVDCLEADYELRLICLDLFRIDVDCLEADCELRLICL
ncbi:hypothetical protein A2U01_0072762, partial [Trifolium medium]|nr:hypothetical protein [Trifolium medium]